MDDGRDGGAPRSGGGAPAVRRWRVPRRRAPGQAVEAAGADELEPAALPLGTGVPLEPLSLELLSLELLSAVFGAGVPLDEPLPARESVR